MEGGQTRMCQFQIQIKGYQWFGAKTGGKKNETKIKKIDYCNFEHSVRVAFKP